MAFGEDCNTLVRDTDWPTLLGFWGLPNLQVINRAAHVEKSATEAASRRRVQASA